MLYCYGCKKTYSVKLPKAPHSWKLKSSVSPTCTMAGSKSYVCKKNKKHTKTVAVKALGHEWDDGLTLRTATYVDTGLVRYTCLRCGTSKDRTISTKGAPLSAKYKLNNAGTGLAAGTVTVTFPDEAVSTANAVVMFWANSNGDLAEYTPVVKKRITAKKMKIKIPDSTIIPSKATQLRVYTYWGLKLDGDGQWQGTRSESFQACKLSSGDAYKPGGSYIQFQVLSDIHINQNGDTDGWNTGGLLYFPQALADIASINPNSTTVIVGDMADTGKESEYQKMDELIGAQEGVDRSCVYLTIGNHDYYSGTSGNPTQMDFSDSAQEERRSVFKKYAAKAAGVSFTSDASTSLYYSKKIDGYYHIMLGSEKQINTVDAYLSDAQLEWFEKQLKKAKAESATKPVFVYLHQSIYETIAGSFAGQNWDGIVNAHTSADDDSPRAKLTAILKKYPQVVMFDGHSHWDLDSMGNIHQRNKNSDGLPTILNTASVGYLWSTFNDLNDIKGTFEEGSQGYYVRVYDDKVVVMGRDFKSGKYVASAMYEIKNMK